MLQNVYFLAKIGADTAENEASKVSSFIPTQAILFYSDILPRYKTLRVGVGLAGSCNVPG